MELRRTEIEGLPVHWTPDGSRYSGGMLFRTGKADEVFPEGGVTHLVEHLALFGLGPVQEYPFNGYVMGLATGFVATGEPEQVAAFLTGVCRSLRNLPFERLAHEARVLRTEAVGRELGQPDHHLWLRYGPTGHGHRSLTELLLFAPDAERVRSWCAERFTRGNAALWFTGGPPPEDLRIDLPPGPRMPPPNLTPIPSVRYPAAAPGYPGGVSVSFVRPRNDWLSVPVEIAGQRIRTRLRFEQGLTYDAMHAYEPLSDRVGHSVLWATCLPDQAVALRDGILGVLGELSTEGATHAELETSRKNFRRSLEDRDNVGYYVYNNAMNELVGFPVKSDTELLDELEALDGAEFARRMAAAMETALFVVPNTCPLPGGAFLAYPSWSEARAEGHTFRTPASYLPWSKGPRLVVGTEGVSFLTVEKRAMTVLYTSCAAVVSRPTGAVDLYGEDGFTLTIDPGEWRDGQKAVRLILDSVPPSLLVRVPPQGAAR